MTRYMAHPATRESTDAEDLLWHDVTAVALAICVLLVIAILASVVPG